MIDRLYRYAEFEIDLSLPVTKESKQTKREAYAQLERQGITPEALVDRPELPEEMAYLWIWFTEMSGLGDLTFTEMKAWSELKGFKLLTKEVEILAHLERIRRSK